MRYPIHSEDGRLVGWASTPDVCFSAGHVVGGILEHTGVREEGEPAPVIDLTERRMAKLAKDNC